MFILKDHQFNGMLSGFPNVLRFWPEFLNNQIFLVHDIDDFRKFCTKFEIFQTCNWVQGTPRGCESCLKISLLWSLQFSRYDVVRISKNFQKT